jgi:hypothetical protein
MIYRPITVLLCALLLSKPAFSQNCADSTAPIAEKLLGRAKTLASEPSMAFAMYRDSVLHIAAVPESSVVFVYSDSVCQMAKNAYVAEVTPQPQHSVRVYVIKIGDDWLVIDPLRFGGTVRIGVLFGPTFIRKSTGNVGM